MSEMYDEYHEYRVDTQRWTKWPKALIMTHEWSTTGHDRRLEQRRYVPDDYAREVERKNYSLQGLVDLYQQEARRALDDEHQTRRNVNRLRDRVHEIAADRDRIKAENAKLRDLVTDMSKAFLTLDIDYCQACPRDKDNRRCQMFVAADGECAFVTEMRELGIEEVD